LAIFAIPVHVRRLLIWVSRNEQSLPRAG
jgi:hypothetical protein